MNQRELLFIIKARNAARGAINQFRKQLKQVGTTAKVAQKQLREMGTSAEKLAMGARTAAGALRQLGATRVGNQISKGMDRARRAISNTVKEALNLRGILAGFGALFLGRAIIGTLAEFGDAMAEVKAISGATEEQFVALRDRARELGAVTRFTATEAAEGLTFLSRAGFSAEQSIAAIKPALLLAQVGVLELGRSADILSNIMSTFGIAAEDAGKVTDVLAFVASKANTNIEQLGQAVKFVGPLARNLGISLNETAAAIGALGDAGLQSTLAGAGLRIAFQRLLDPSKKAREAIVRLGLSLDELDPAKAGNSLTKIVEKLKEAEIRVGSGEFARAATQIFSARGSTVLQSLVTNIDKFKELGEATKTAGGFATEAARIMDANLGGAIKIATAAMQELILSMGAGGLGPVIEGMVRGFTSVVQAVGSFFTLFEQGQGTMESTAEAVKKFTIVLVTLAGIMLGKMLVGWLATNLALIGYAKGILIAVFRTRTLSSVMLVLNSAMRANPIGAIIALIGLLVVAYELLKDVTFQVGETTVRVGQLVQFAWSKVVAGFQVVVASIGLVGNLMLDLINLDFSKMGKTASEGMKDLELAVFSGRQSLEDFVKAQNEAANKAKDTNSDIKAAARERGTDAKKANKEALEAIKTFNTEIGNLEGALLPAVKATQEFEKRQTFLTKALTLSDGVLKSLGTSRQRLLDLQMANIAAHEKETNAIRAGTKALREEARLIGLTGVERQIAQARLEAERGASQRDPTGRTGVNEADFIARAAALRSNAQRQFMSDLKESTRAQRVELALLGKSKEEIDRIKVAMDVMKKAKEAGFDAAKVREFGLEAVAALDAITEKQKELAADATRGITSGFKKFIEESKDAAAQMEEVTTKAIKGIEDAFFDFIKGGKLDFRSLAQSMADDLLRSNIKGILGSLFEGLGLGDQKKKPGSIVDQAGGLFRDTPDSPVGKIRKAGSNISDALNDVARMIQQAGSGGGTSGFLSGDDLGFSQDDQIFQRVREVANDAGVGLDDIMSGFNSDLSASFVEGTKGTQSIFDSFLGGFGGIFKSLLSSIGDLFSGGGGGGFDLSSIFGGSGGGFLSGISSFFGFAKGGIATARGAVELRKFAEGGITTNPSLALFGEGDKPEAFVPLPDGRRIPVTIAGGGPTRITNLTNNIQVSTPDAGSFGRNRDQIARRAGIAFQRAMNRDN